MKKLFLVAVIAACVVMLQSFDTSGTEIKCFVCTTATQAKNYIETMHKAGYVVKFLESQSVSLSINGHQSSMGYKEPSKMSLAGDILIVMEK